MKSKDILFGIIEFIVWVVFAYYALYSLKNPVDLKLSALILVILAYVGVLVCPIFRSTSAFKAVYRR